MADDSNSPRRRDLLKAGATAGLLGVAGLSLNGASAQETTTQGTTQAQGEGGTGVFSFSLEDGDLFRVRFRPRDPFGQPATESVPAACLGGQSEEYQLFIVRTFRADADVGFRGLLAPQQALAEDLLQTTTEAAGMTETTPAGETTTEAAMQDQTTTAAGQETTAAGQATTTAAGGQLPEIQLGAWYRVATAEPCDGLNRLTIEAADPPETTPVPGETTTQ
ncbi:hypothetical protein M0R89_00030 [Halorussus limi]|uniref:Uncharacterized protein n=1 Tax=Halorussus limi TaxID=2938695 RepID=A0A8U0HV02_9EURY|nr:hypothetical protein [Halorussus limi]UPV74474.1 hypothetical protein M0R89_00030 [Halorussus limi]